MEWIVAIGALVVAILAVAAAAWLGRERGVLIGRAAEATARVEAAERERDGARGEAERQAAALAEAGRRVESLTVAIAENRARLEGEKRQYDAAIGAADELHRQRLGAAQEAFDAALAKEREVLGAEKRALAEKHEELVKQLAAMKDQMEHTFAALASKVLETTGGSLLRQVEGKFGDKQKEGDALFQQQRKAVEELVKPIAETLKSADVKLAEMEKERTGAYAGLVEQVKGMAGSNEALRQETGKLVRALSRPEVRGRYGEIQLRRVAELAGMTAYCDFTEQESTRDGEGRLLRPDVVVKLPNERVLAVDAKTNVQAYVEAASATSPELQEGCLERFARHVAEQVTALGKKGYWKEFDGSPEFVVMFVPGDQFLDAALARRPDLLDKAAEQGVILASPATLIGLLRAVAVGWREKKITDRAKELMDECRELHKRAVKAYGEAARLGASIEAVVNRFNDFAGSYQSRLLPHLRRMEEFGAGSDKAAPELAEVDLKPRLLEGARGGAADETRADVAGV